MRDARRVSRYFYARYQAQSERDARTGRWGASAAHAPATPLRLTDAYAVLWLRAGAPPEVVRAAYRALAARHHPDVGGDAAAMRRLNEAYALLSARGQPAIDE